MGKREEIQRIKLEQMTEYEKPHWAKGEYLIAGIDEAGRDDLILGVDDSKK